MQRPILISACAVSFAALVGGSGCDNSPQVTRYATPLSASQGGAQLATGMPPKIFQELCPTCACAAVRAGDFNGALELTVQYPTSLASIGELSVADDHVYIAGSAASVDFGTDANLGSPGGFVAKLEPGASGVWLRALTSQTGVMPEVHGLTTDEGLASVTAIFPHSLELDGVQILASLNPGDVGHALMSFDGDGTPLWYAPYLEDTLTTFEPLGGQFTVSGSLLVRRDVDGSILWAAPVATSFAPDALMRPLRARTDAEGNLLIVAEYFRTFQIGADSLASDGAWGSLVAKFGPGGEPLWYRSVAGAGMLTDIDADSSGNLVIAGRSPELPSDAPNPRLMVAKYDALGRLVFVRSWDVPSWEPWQVVTDPWDNIVLVGQVEGSIDFGSGELSGLVLAKLDPCGNALWSRSIAGTLQAERPGLDVDADGHVWLGTSFTGAVTVLGTELQVSSGSAEDVLLVEIGK